MSTEIYCITLWQPWASWIALGWKTIESRSHGRFDMLRNRYVGIHAGLRWDENALGVASDFLTMEQMHITEELRKVRGVVVCTAYVEDHRALTGHDSAKALIDCEYTRRFGLVLEDIKPLQTPIPLRGKQGIWTTSITL